MCTSDRLQLFRGDLHPNEAWKYYLERRLAAMGRAFKQSEQNAGHNEDALSIALSKIADTEIKEQMNANVKQSSIKACWWIEELVASNQYAVDDLCLLAGRQMFSDPRNTRSLSPSRKVSPEPADGRSASPDSKLLPNTRGASPDSKVMTDQRDTRSVSPDGRPLANPRDTRSVSPDRRPTANPRDTRSVSPDRRLTTHHHAEVETGLSHTRSVSAQSAPDDARLVLAFNKQVFHSPSPDVIGINSIPRRLPVPPKGKWHPAELAFEDNTFRPPPEAKSYGSAAWLAKKKASKGRSASKQCSTPIAFDTEHSEQPPRCMTAPPTNGNRRAQDREDIPDGPRDGTPSTAAPSSPLRDCTPLRHSSPLRESHTPATPDWALTSRGRYPHDGKFTASHQENLPARPQTSQGGDLGHGRHPRDGKYVGREDLPARPRTSQGGAISHDTGVMAQPMTKTQPQRDLEAKACRESASPVKALTHLGFFADHLVQSSMANSPDADADGQGVSPVRSALERTKSQTEAWRLCC